MSCHCSSHEISKALTESIFLIVMLALAYPVGVGLKNSSVLFLDVSLRELGSSGTQNYTKLISPFLKLGFASTTICYATKLVMTGRTGKGF